MLTEQDKKHLVGPLEFPDRLIESGGFLNLIDPKQNKMTELIFDFDAEPPSMLDLIAFSNENESEIF